MDQTVGVSTDSVGIISCAHCHVQISVEGIPPFAEVECPACSHTNVVPARLGQFLLLDLMGEGGMGGVYKAIDETLGRQVAIKVMLASLGDDPEFISSFRREAQAIARLNHPHIAQIYSFGQEKGQPYIVMELVSGSRLDALMEKGQQLDQGLILRTAIEVSLGLQAADEAGLVHGDIKPENILYDEKNQAKLVDFGLASAAHEKSQDQAIWGTPYYIPPEKIRRQKLDARADIYSLGGTLYHALTGKPPFDGETAIEVVKARLDAPPVPIEEIRPDVDERLSAIIMRMLELDPARRYPTYGSLLADLRKCAEESRIQMQPKSRNLGKRKVVIKRRGGGQTAVATTPSTSTAGPSAPPAPPQTGHKLVIHKSTTSPTGSYRIPGTDSPPAAGLTPEELQAQHERRVAARKRTIRIVLTLLTILALSGAAVAILLIQKAKREAQVQRYHLSESKTRGANASARITTHLSELQEIYTTASALRDQANDDAMRVTGSVPELPPLKLPEPPPPDPATETATNAPAASTNSTTDVVADTEASAGDETADADTEAAAVVDDTSTDTPDAPAEPQEIPEIHTLAVVVGIAHRDLARLASEAASLREATVIASNKLIRAVSSAEAAPFETELAHIDTQAASLLESARKELRTIRESARACARIRADYDQDEAARIQAEKDERRRQAEEAARNQQMQAEQERLNTEKARVDQAHQALLPSIQIHNFDAVDTQIRTMGRTIETTEGKTYLKRLTDRVDVLKEMQQIMIDRLTESGYSYGYGSGVTARDILKADSRGIYVRGAIAPVRWAELTPTDTLKIIEHLLRAPTTLATQKMTLAAGAAIYCDAFGERGREKGNAYAQRAESLGMRADRIAALRPEGW